MHKKWVPSGIISPARRVFSPKQGKTFISFLLCFLKKIYLVNYKMIDMENLLMADNTR